MWASTLFVLFFVHTFSAPVKRSSKEQHESVEVVVGRATTDSYLIQWLAFWFNAQVTPTAHPIHWKRYEKSKPMLPSSEQQTFTTKHLNSFWINSCAPDHNTFQTFFEQRVEFYANDENAFDKRKTVSHCIQHFVHRTQFTNFVLVRICCLCTLTRRFERTSRHRKSVGNGNQKKDKNICWTEEKKIIGGSSSTALRYHRSDAQAKHIARIHERRLTFLLLCCVVHKSIVFSLSFVAAYSEHFLRPIFELEMFAATGKQQKSSRVFFIAVHR